MAAADEVVADGPRCVECVMSECPGSVPGGIAVTPGPEEFIKRVFFELQGRGLHCGNIDGVHILLTLQKGDKFLARHLKRKVLEPVEDMPYMILDILVKRLYVVLQCSPLFLVDAKNVSGEGCSDGGDIEKSPPPLGGRASFQDCCALANEARLLFLPCLLPAKLCGDIL